MEPRDVVGLFLDHGRRDGDWNMDVIEQCFDDRYWSHTWHGDLAHTRARQDRCFSALEPIEELSSDLLAEEISSCIARPAVSPGVGPARLISGRW